MDADSYKERFQSEIAQIAKQLDEIRDDAVELMTDLKKGVGQFIQRFRRPDSAE